MSLSKALDQGVGSIVIIDDLYLSPNPEAVSGEALATLLRGLREKPAECKDLAAVLGKPEITEPAKLVDLVSEDLPKVYEAHLSGHHAYLQTLFADLDETHTAGLRRLRILEAELTAFFKVNPLAFGSLEDARKDLSTCSIVFVDFFLEGVSTHEQARKHHSMVSKELAEKFTLGEQRFPKVVVLMSSTLPPTSELAIFRKETGVRGAFFHTIDKATFNTQELRSSFQGFIDGYATACQLNEYMEAIETVITSAATGLTSELRSRLDVHDLTILKTLRLDGESDTPQAYLTLLLAEALAARVRMAPALQAEVLPKEHAYGDLPFDGKLLPSSVLFELFADVAVAPVPSAGTVKVAFGDILEALDGGDKAGLLLAISPACDLQRCSPGYEVLCVPGSVVESNASLPALFERSYSFGHGNVVLRIPDAEGAISYSSIVFDVKSLKTVPAALAQDARKYRRIARLTEVFAQEVKTLALNHAARVGVPIDPSFSVGLKALVRFSFTGDEKGAPQLQGEHEIDGSEFLPAVLAMGRELDDNELRPTVMFSAQFKERLQKIILEKLAEQKSNKLSAVAAHFAKPDSFKVSFEKDSWAKSFGQISIRHYHKLPKLGDAKNFEIVVYSELAEDKVENGEQLPH